MGCLTLRPDERTGVKQRRQIRMGMLEVVLLYKPIQHVMI